MCIIAETPANVKHFTVAGQRLSVVVTAIADRMSGSLMDWPRLVLVCVTHVGVGNNILLGKFYIKQIASL